MNAAYIIYHLTKADLLERVRRYSFLIILGMAVFLGSQIAINNLALQLDEYRGEINSAWVGSLMSLMGTFFIGWFGFYLVKGSITHDRKTGVGQILASTRMSQALYLFGKWTSNFAILMVLNVILVLIGIGIQFLVGESTAFNPFAILTPFILITLPTMVLVAATAVFFESIKFLNGGFGSVVYFFLFVFASDSLDKSQMAYGFDPTGMGILRRSMWAAAKSAYPHFNGGFAVDIQANLEPVKYTFQWTGVDWTPELILQRLALIGIALVLLMMASAFFDRFEVSKTKRARIWKFKKRAPVLADNNAPALPAASAVSLTPLKPSAKRFSFIHLLNAELKLLLNESPWWSFAVAILLVIACGITPSTLARSYLLPTVWVWPILLWSSIGTRDLKHNVQQLTFSSAFPVWRQLPAQWLAGFLITFGMGFGFLLSLMLGGETTGLLTFFSAAIFIPSLALASGVWSGSNKLFEVLYIFIWYFGPINHLLGLDFIGTQGSGRPAFFIPLSLLLMALAVWGKKRQIAG